MKILLVSATQLEIQEYLVSAPHHDVLITGIGLPAAMYELTNQLHGHRYDLVIQAGVAGAFTESKLQLGDVVAVQQDAFGDAGSYEGDQIKSLQELGLTNDKEWLANTHHQILSKSNLPLVNGITVTTLTNYQPFIAALQQKWEAQIESMEGAALHFICAKRKVPFLQIRSVSNIVGDRDKSNWLLGTAIGNLNQTLKALIPKLS